MSCSLLRLGRCDEVAGWGRLATVTLRPESNARTSRHMIFRYEVCDGQPKCAFLWQFGQIPIAFSTVSSPPLANGIL